MCEDCERAFEEVLQNKPECDCKDCMLGGHVLAIEHPPGEGPHGLTPWCVGCHHFILTGQARKK